MPIRVLWDKYEVAYLVDRCLAVMNNDGRRSDIVASVSAELRQRAINRGREIDELFRNANGISMQMSVMEYHLTHGKKGLAKPNKLFAQMASLYETSFEEYQSILAEAKKQIWKADETQPEAPQEETRKYKKQTVDFEHLVNFAFSVPISYKYSYHNTKEVADWQTLYLEVVRWLSKDYPSVFSGTTVFSVSGKSDCSDLRGSKAFRKPEKIRPGLYLETDLSTIDKLRRIKSMLLSCGLTVESLCIKYYLDEDAKAKKEFDTYVAQNKAPVFSVKWTMNDDYSGTKPTSFKYKNHRYEEVTSWSGLWISFLKRVIVDYPGKFKSAYRYKNNTKADIGRKTHARKMIRPVEIAPGLYAEANMDSNTLVARIADIMTLIKAKPSDVKVNYMKKADIAFWGGADQMESSNWQQFLLWLQQENTPAVASDILARLSTVNALGRKNKKLKTSIGQIENASEIEVLQKSVMHAKEFGIHSKKLANSINKALEVYKQFLLIPPNTSEEEIVDTTEYEVDFSAPRSYSHTKPVECKYKGELVNGRSWNALFHELVQLIYRDYKDIFPVGQSLSASARIDTGSPDGMIYPKEIADGIYLECNVNASGIVNKLRSLMDICGITYSDITIRYRRSGTLDGETSSKEPPVPKWQPKYTEVITRLLSARYKYGFRIGSPIEMMKIRNYAEGAQLLLPESDEELEKEIRAAGLTIDGKVYVFSHELLDELGSLFDDAFASGAEVIFLEPFVEKNVDWLEEHHISAEATLKEVLQKSRPEFYVGQNIITAGARRTEHEAVVSEIHRVAEDNSVVSMLVLPEQLEYIPADKIAWSLSASDEFARVGEGRYFRMRYFICGDEEAEAIIRFVEGECSSKGYASITDIPLGELQEENYEFPIFALQTAVYNTVLKGKFYLNGKIITVDQQGVDISVLLKAFCSERTECTLSEMMARAEDLTGSTSKQYSITALYDTMIRADIDRFVTEKQVHFDVDRIDALLEEVIGNRFGPLKKVSTFALFPTCGLSWNHYLLESYCYRFSKKYRLSVLNYNDKNSGIIVAIDLPLSYNDMICEAIAAADVELTEEIVGNYLYENGYTTKRKYPNLTNNIERAKIIREEG